jgi:hypothetical protein
MPIGCGHAGDDRRGAGRESIPGLQGSRKWPRQIACNRTPVAAEYGTTRSSRFFVVSPRTRNIRRPGYTSSVRSEHNSSRRASQFVVTTGRDPLSPNLIPRN